MVFNSFSISLSFSDPLSPMSPLQAECMPQRKQITAPSAENNSAVKNLCELCNLFFGIRYRQIVVIVGNSLIASQLSSIDRLM